MKYLISSSLPLSPDKYACRQAKNEREARAEAKFEASITKKPRMVFKLTEIETDEIGPARFILHFQHIATYDKKGLVKEVF